MSEERLYYVYLHRKETDNEIFYVGKGKGDRAYKTGRRSELWKSIRNKYGRIVEIYKDNLTEKEALDLEMKLIKELGRIDLGTGNLVNFTDGGDTTNLSPEARKKISESAKNRVFSEETLKKFSQVRWGKFKNNPHVILGKETGERLSGTFAELLDHFGRDYYSRLRNLLAQRTKSLDGWCLNPTQETFDAIRESRSRTPNEKFTFMSLEEVVVCTKAEFYKKTGIHHSPLFYPKKENRRVHKGWTVLRDGESVDEVLEILSNKVKAPRYIFFNESLGEEFLGTVTEFCNKYNIKKTSASDLFRKITNKSNKQPKVMGWIIKEKYGTE